MSKSKFSLLASSVLLFIVAGSLCYALYSLGDSNSKKSNHWCDKYIGILDTRGNKPLEKRDDIGTIIQEINSDYNDGRIDGKCYDFLKEEFDKTIEKEKSLKEFLSDLHIYAKDENKVGEYSFGPSVNAIDDRSAYDIWIDRLKKDPVLLANNGGIVTYGADYGNDLKFINELAEDPEKRLVFIDRMLANVKDHKLVKLGAHQASSAIMVYDKEDESSVPYTRWYDNIDRIDGEQYLLIETLDGRKVLLRLACGFQPEALKDTTYALHTPTGRSEDDRVLKQIQPKEAEKPVNAQNVEECSDGSIRNNEGSCIRPIKPSEATPKPSSDTKESDENA